MTTSGTWHLIQWLHYLALSLWIGGITFFSAGVAPVVHRSMASKAVAGEIVGSVLKRLNILELLCCFSVLATSLCSFRFIQSGEKNLWYLIVAILLMGSLTFFYTFHLTPRMESLKEKIPTLDALSSSHAAKIEFDRLHRIYVKLMTFNLALGLIVLYGSIVVLKT